MATRGPIIPMKVFQVPLHPGQTELMALLAQKGGMNKLFL